MVSARTFALWSVIWSTFLSAQDPFYRRFTMADGLPSNTIYRAIQDKDGFMWFATDAGVARFDGLEFKVFTNKDGLGDSEIIFLHEDSKGRIWFLSLNGRLSFWYNGTIHNGSTEPDLARYRGVSGWHTAVEDRQGRIWFGGVFGELVRIDLEGSRDTVVQDMAGKKLSLWRNRDGSVWAEAKEFMVALDGPDAGKTVPLPSAPRARRVEQQLPWNSPPVLFSGDRIVEVEDGVLTPIVPDLRVEATSTYRNCWREAEGNIWLYRTDLGIDLLARSSDGRYAPRHLFPSLRINSVYQDHRGDRWLSTAGNGVLFIGHDALEGTHVFRTEAGRSEGLLCMHADGERVWLGSDHGAIYTFDRKALVLFSAYESPESLGRVLRIDGRPGKSIWYAHDFGLLALDPGADGPVFIPAINTENGRTAKVPGVLKTVFVARDGAVWAGSKGLMKLEYENGTRIRKGFLADQFKLDRITRIAEDATGTLWLDSDGGLISVKDSVRRFHPVYPGHPLARISDLTAWAGDTLAIATAGDGIFLWSKDRIAQHIGQSEGLASDVVRRIRVHGDTLWAATAAGVSAFVFAGGEVVATWNWTESDGLPSTDTRDVLVYAGRLLTLSDAGLCVSALRPERPPMDTPRLYLAGLRTERGDITSPGMFELQGGEDRLFVAVHAITFAQPGAVEYMFRLNRSGMWSTCEKGQVRLDRLSASDSLVEVRARFPGYAWSRPYHIPFTVRPPWYERAFLHWSAILLGVFLVVFGVHAVSRRRYRRQLAVAEAKAALDAERQRIAADVHDDLGADLSQLLLHARHQQQEGGSSKKHVTDGIEAAIHKIDEIIWSLDPRRDTLKATILFIEGLARDLAEAHGLKFRTSVPSEELDQPFSAEQRRDLMLLSREAIRNVVQHARAKELRIRWERDGGTLRLIIEDDGIGIQEGIRVGRNGLVNIRNRAERLGAELFVGKGDEGGTRVEIHLRLVANHPIG